MIRYKVILMTLLSTIMVNTAVALEAQLWGATEWPNSPCTGGARGYWDDMGDAWYDEITNTGFSIFGLCLWGHCDDAYSRDYRYVNGNLNADFFMETQLFPAGEDRHSNRVDEADAAMIFTHGADWNNAWHGLMRKKDSNGDCFLDSDTELRAGDYDLEFLHLSSCNSLDDNQISTAYQRFGYPDKKRKLHLLTGFHGCMWIGNSFVNDYRDFADDAFHMSIGLAWMQNMYRTNINGQYTQCPVAYAVGSTVDDCLNRLTTEQYDAVKSDPSTAGAYCYYYYANCDPDCEDAFGNAWK